MTRDEFRRLAETWGGDIDRWPAEYRAAARVVAASPEGADIIDQQRGLDILLAHAPAVSEKRAADAVFGVMQRLAVPEQRASWYLALWRPSRIVPVASLACSAVLGLWLASFVPLQQQEGAAVVTMMFDSGSLASSWMLQ
jgi:hypothetical protein